MTRRALLAAVLAALLTAGPALGWTIPPSGSVVTPTEQVLLSASSNFPSNVNPSYIPLGFAGDALTADSKFSTFAVPATITEIRGRSVTAPTGAQTWTFELMKNGSGTGLSCAVNSGSSAKCNATGGSVAFAAGDWGSIKITPSGSPTANRMQLALVATPDTANDTLLFAHGIGFSTSATQGVALGNNTAPGTTSARRYTTMPVGGTIDRLYINSNAPGAGTNYYAYTAVKNGSTTALTASIADTAIAANDTTHSFSVTGASGSTAGDDLLMQAVPASTPASATAGFGMRFIPDCAPCFPLIGAFNINTHATNTFYYPITGGPNLGTATEANNQSLGATMTITAIAVKVLTAPGVGKSQLITLRQNGADTACTVTIADTAVANTASCSISVANDDLLDTSVAPTGSPTATSLGISYLASR